jgi:hypothetical protein
LRIALRAVAGLIAALVGIGGVVPAAAATYQFASKYATSIPPSQSDWFFSGEAPAINNFGLVAFSAALKDHGVQGPFGIYRGNGGPADLLASQPFILSPFTMNNAGTVAYKGVVGGQLGIYKTNGGVPQTVATAQDFSDLNYNSTLGIMAPVQINDAGAVLFDGLPIVGPQQHTAYVMTGGPPIPVMASELGQAINNLGIVALSDYSQILGVPPIGPTTVMATNPPGYYGIGYPEINDAGDVLASAFDGNAVHLFYFQHGAPTPPIDLGYIGIGSFDINNTGGIAFEDATGIYTGPNAVNDHVISLGDSLFGATATRLVFGTDGLNDLGQIAFYYELNTGVHGIAIATPVPEPGSFILALGAMAALGATIRRSRFVATRTGK